MPCSLGLLLYIPEYLSSTRVVPLKIIHSSSYPKKLWPNISKVVIYDFLDNIELSSGRNYASWAMKQIKIWTNPLYQDKYSNNLEIKTFWGCMETVERMYYLFCLFDVKKCCRQRYISTAIIKIKDWFIKIKPNRAIFYESIFLFFSCWQ